jgi:hypothetical protein
MRLSAIVLIAMAVLLIPEWAEAQEKLEPGGKEFLRSKHPKIGKDYYVVREGQSDQCSIVGGTWGDKPVGALGDAPYASEKYAKAALKTFPECKGGEVDATDSEKHTDSKKHGE